MSQYPTEFIHKILNRAIKTNGPLLTPCLIWLGAASNNRGVVRYKGQNLKAYRVVCEYFHGDIPATHCVMHICDNSLCINPEHLRIGTYTENVKDSINKQRRNNVGINNTAAKLNEDKVNKIRELLITNEIPDIAKLYGVSISTIKDIKYFRTWRHV